MFFNKDTIKSILLHEQPQHPGIHLYQKQIVSAIVLHPRGSKKTREKRLYATFSRVPTLCNCFIHLFYSKLAFDNLSFA